jgi:hypothetical protein
MKTNEIAETIKNIQAGLDQIQDPIAKTLIESLFNLVEALYAENTQLKQDNQDLRDEINRLKGEQGKPKFSSKIKTDGDVSSDSELKKAEGSVEERASKEGFRLTSKTLKQLKEQEIPPFILDQLQPLRTKEYTDSDDFMATVENIIGKEAADKYRELLLKYARYYRRNRSSKIKEIKIDREEICMVDLDRLPKDAVCKGYEPKTVQDLKITTDNVRFQREVFYSPSLKKTYLGDLPPGYDGGDYGASTKAHILTFYHHGNMSIPKIVGLLDSYRIQISSTYISRLLTKGVSVFHQDKDDVFQAGLQSSSYQQIDDTTTKVNGKKHYTQIVCNSLYTVFSTTPQKDRLTILDVLRNFKDRTFLLNEETYELLRLLRVPEIWIERLKAFDQDQTLDTREIQGILEQLFPQANKYKNYRKSILEASAISAYHHETEIPVVEILLCDDASQFKLLTKYQMLCWIHEGRHYKRLNPIISSHQKKLDNYLQRFWEYYRRLLDFKKAPSDEQSKNLDLEFDQLFNTQTGYKLLDERIQKTKEKKKRMLTVLKYPEIPLHNNVSENSARLQKRREDVSLQRKNDAGVKAKDSMMSLVETARKLKVKIFEYFYDRISGQFRLPSLADLIREKTP